MIRTNRFFGMCAVVAAAFLCASCCALDYQKGAEASVQTQIHTGRLMFDTSGRPVNAHGGGMIFADGTYYWYGEHKIPNKSEKQMADGGIHCYASKDLVNWNDMGVVLSVDYEDPKSEIAYGCILERPKVLYNARTKKYSAYFKLYEKGKGYDTSYIGIAVADRPEGPFKYSHRILGANSEKGSGDFYLHVDKNGKLFHLAVRKPDKAFCITAFDDDYMRTIPGSTKVLEGIKPHTEAPAGFYHGGKFYLLGSGSSGWAPNAARLYVADSVHGPYTDLGNPVSGKNPLNDLGPEKTFGGQSSFVMKVEGKKDAYIAMFDQWFPNHPIEGKYIWLPIDLSGNTPAIKWIDAWDLSVFGSGKKPQ